MNDMPESTPHLLSLLLGKRTAKRICRDSVVELLLDDSVPEDVKVRLRASRELVRRWMLEELRQKPVLSSPNVVREYLAVHYSGQEREVFSCLFLDSRHRLISVEEMFLGTVDGASVHPREVAAATEKQPPRANRSELRPTRGAVELREISVLGLLWFAQIDYDSA